jgi:hypothetical protein
MLSLAAAAPLRAGGRPAPPVEPGSGIELSLRTPFEEPPLRGACTVEVTLRNGSGRDGRWELALHSDDAYWWTASTQATVSVAAGATRTFVLVGALTGRPGGWGAHPTSSAYLGVRGPGVSRQRVNVCHRQLTLVGPPAGSPAESSSFAMSASLARVLWDPMDAEMKARSEAMAGSRFEPADLPADARSYAGFANIFLRGEEWTSLPADRREAVLDWVALGGTLCLLGPPAEQRRLGLGWVRSWPVAAEPAADVRQALQEIASVPAADPRFASLGPQEGQWTLPGRLARPESHHGAVFVVLLTVSAVIGPLNLFWLARGRHRHRVYWTTPLLASAAAAVMMVMILLRDGVGGEGYRWTTVAVMPGSHRAAVVQEQVSRTGLLLSTGFEAREPMMGWPLSYHEGTEAVQSPMNQQSSGPRQGGWFSSRTLQAHYLETIRPTRARVQVHFGSRVEAVSSIEDTLDGLLVVDDAGRGWYAPSAAAGQRVVLEPAGDVAGWLDDRLQEAGPVNRRHLQKLRDARGYFFARARRGAPIETLDSIRWKESGFLYLGPVEPLS